MVKQQLNCGVWAAGCRGE